jgi:hypothetical protein
VYVIDPPNRSAIRWEAAQLAAQDAGGSLDSSPDQLDREDIHEAPNLFQPRFDSIAYAPGRSGAHVAELARIAKRGTPLDPVTVVAFGDRWYLVDGHHRLAAYGEAGWAKPVPVRAVGSALRGQERVDWAIALSIADNAKNRLNISTADKADAAWLAIARKADRSKADMVATYGISDGLVADMRRVRGDLEAAGMPPAACTGWRAAKRERDRLRDDAGPGAPGDFGEMRRRQAAKRLQPVMEMRLPPDQLAEALEQFSPGIVEAMAAARRLAGVGAE